MVDSVITTFELQHALITLGYDLGKAGADGIWGRATLAAVKAFQLSVGLEGTGIVGPRTTAALVGKAALTPRKTLLLPRPWVEEAHRWMGLNEHDKEDAAQIVEAAQTIGASWYKSAATPWCGVAVGYWISAALPEERLPKVPLRARDWLNWGVALAGGAYGAVCVLERGGGGHVFLALARSPDGKFVKGIGGNQSDKVTEAWFESDRVLGYRWPRTVHLPNSPMPIEARRVGKVSTNEA
jgi:uncharacterized protein (TIGR02594 family)